MTRYRPRLPAGVPSGRTLSASGRTWTAWAAFPARLGSRVARHISHEQRDAPHSRFAGSRLGCHFHDLALVQVEISVEAVGQSKRIRAGKDEHPLDHARPIYCLKASGGLSDKSPRS